MALTTPTKPNWSHFTTDDIFRANSPGEPHSLPRFSSPISPRTVKRDPKSRIEQPTVSPITPMIKEEKRCRLILRLPHRQDSPIVKEEKTKLCRLIIHPPTLPPFTTKKMVTRSQKHKVSLKLRLTPPRTPINKSLLFRGKSTRNWIRWADFEEHKKIGITPLMGKCKTGEEFVGLSGVDMGDEERGKLGEKRVGMGLYDGAGGEMSAGMQALRERLWGRGSWAVRDTEG